jgi:nucleoside-diphosphate-sugar epimerase
MGDVFNIGTGRRISVLDLAVTLAKLTGNPHIQPSFLPEREGDVKHSQADITLARQTLGYEPVTGFEQGLEETIEWVKRTMATA